MATSSSAIESIAFQFSDADLQAWPSYQRQSGGVGMTFPSTVVGLPEPVPGDPRRWYLPRDCATAGPGWI